MFFSKHFYRLAVKPHQTRRRSNRNHPPWRRSMMRQSESYLDCSTTPRTSWG